MSKLTGNGYPAIPRLARPAPRVQTSAQAMQAASPAIAGASSFLVRVRTATADRSYFAQDISSVNACLSALDAESDAPCGVTVKPAAAI